MRVWKRLGAALVTLTALAVILTGTALAAEPGDISVQLDGQGLTFTDAVPEITSDRTFLPFRAVLEAMGAEVGYDAETTTVSAQKDGVTMAMIPGQTTLTVTEGGQTRTVEMDAAPYIKASNGRTYIPVRYAAESFGYSVGWDAGTRTVVLVDVDALFGDATFALMDNLAAYSAKQGDIENMSITGNLNANLNDSSGTVLTGPLNIKGSLEGIVSEKGIQLTGKVDASALVTIFGATLGGAIDTDALQALPEITAELRAGLDSKMLYVSVPDILSGGTGNIWYSLDWSDLEVELSGLIDLDQLTQLQAQLADAGIREALTAVLQTLPMDDSTSSYEVAALLVNTYKDLLSDQAFTQQGNTYVAKTRLEDIMDLTVTLTKRGDDIVAADVSMSCEVEDAGSRFVMTLDEHAAPDKVDVVMELSVDGGDVTMDLHLDLNCAPTSKAPVITLPAGAQALPLN